MDYESLAGTRFNYVHDDGQPPPPNLNPKKNRKMKPNDCKTNSPKISQSPKFSERLLWYQECQHMVCDYLRADMVSDAIRLELEAREVFYQLIQEGK